MLAVQQAQGKPGRRQGCALAGLAELREVVSGAAPLSATAKARLAELSQRLARVQAMSGELSGVCFSPMAAAAVAGHSATD